MIKLFFTTILIFLCIPCFAQAKEAEEGLVIHYTFEEGSGRTLRDHSGNKLHGKINGAKWVKDDFGTALEFDGKDDFVECSYSEATDTPDSFSVEAWVYPRDYGGGIFCRVLGSKWTDERLVLATFYRAEKTPSCVFCISDGAKYD
ncbi:hypothetical protein KKC91_01705, partial [bacterium]|nr:hypothetical protein [bacterium]